MPMIPAGAEFVKQIIERGDKVIAAGRSYESMSGLKDAGAVLALWDVSAPLEQLQRICQGGMFTILDGLAVHTDVVEV
jgi:uncharacterized linocin/CFP29 family protein